MSSARGTKPLFQQVPGILILEILEYLSPFQPEKRVQKEVRSSRVFSHLRSGPMICLFRFDVAFFGRIEEV
uniref:Uncharacterized protein n=1 Tax=Thermosporothrix sp. COM3 TaxID=2490863 RepID=A0A455SGX5_9CHLR|nr:hypothetical protein KTC_15410 [Thermosporothrix sp. COM3]